MTHTDRDLQVPLRERAPSEAVHAAVRARLSDYLDGSLPEPEVDEIRQHLDWCTPCQAFWRTLLRLINTTGQLPRRTIPQAAKDRLTARL